MDTPEFPTPDQPSSSEPQPPESPSQTPPPSESSPFEGTPSQPSLPAVPPQTPYYDPNAPFGYQNQGQYGGGYYAPPQQQYGGTTSRSFSDIWMIIWTQLDVDAYRDVLREGDISLRRSATWVGVAYGIQMFVSLVVGAIVGVNNFNSFNNSQFSQNAETSMNPASVICVGIFCVPALAVIAVGLYFLLAVGIPHVVAKALGGKGRYEQTAFLYSAVYAPTLLIGAIRAFGSAHIALQCIGVLIGLAVFLYGLVMESVAIKAAHDMDWFRSIVSALSPIIIGVILGVCCFGLILLAAASSS